MSNHENFYRGDAYLGFGDRFIPERYSEYVRFVRSHMGDGAVVEIGSGLGAAAAALAAAGQNVTASDIFPDLARAKFAELGLSIPVVELNATSNALPNDSVDNYSLYQVLEHIEDPRACFRECFRTLKPGGRIVVVSPNLLSPLTSLRALVEGCARRWGTPWLRRTDGYSFPFGSTMLEVVLFCARNFALAGVLRAWPGSRQARYRKPCVAKPARSDSDAVFLSEPLTVRALLRREGFEIDDFQSARRLRSWAGSIWIVARKPEHSA